MLYLTEVLLIGRDRERLKGEKAQHLVGIEPYNLVITMHALYSCATTALMSKSTSHFPTFAAVWPIAPTISNLS